MHRLHDGERCLVERDIGRRRAKRRLHIGRHLVARIERGEDQVVAGSLPEPRGEGTRLPSQPRQCLRRRTIVVRIALDKTDQFASNP